MKFFLNRIYGQHDNEKSILCKMENKALINHPNKIFDRLCELKKYSKSTRDLFNKKQKILDELSLEYYEFDNIYTFNEKKTNHQELLYCEKVPLTVASINKVYRGKLKIWYHKTVNDHVCLSETVPYKIIDVAVKVIEHSDAVENENNEPEMLYYLRDNVDIIRLYGYHIDSIKEKCLLVLEWCDGGDLFSYVETKYLQKKSGIRIVPISLVNIKYIIKWLINSILKCHKHNICHSDLKLDNIMFAIRDDITSLRLIDFGASKFICDNGRDIIYNFISTTVHYTPPEIINRYHMKLNCPFLRGYNVKGDNLFKIDIWQIGIISYVLTNGHFPFDSAKTDKKEKYNDIFRTIESCKPLSFTKNKDINGIPLCDDNCIDFISKLIAYNPYERMSLQNALDHPWLA
jgi:serine/threonine protein kinase